MCFVWIYVYPYNAQHQYTARQREFVQKYKLFSLFFISSYFYYFFYCCCWIYTWRYLNGKQQKREVRKWLSMEKKKKGIESSANLYFFAFFMIPSLIWCEMMGGSYYDIFSSVLIIFDGYCYFIESWVLAKLDKEEKCVGVFFF